MKDHIEANCHPRLYYYNCNLTFTGPRYSLDAVANDLIEVARPLRLNSPYPRDIWQACIHQSIAIMDNSAKVQIRVYDRERCRWRQPAHICACKYLSAYLLTWMVPTQGNLGIWQPLVICICGGGRGFFSATAAPECSSNNKDWKLPRTCWGLRFTTGEAHSFYVKRNTRHCIERKLTGRLKQMTALESQGSHNKARRLHML